MKQETTMERKSRWIATYVAILRGLGFRGLGWVLPPLSTSWIINIIWLYIALNRTPNTDCYWVGAVPKV